MAFPRAGLRDGDVVAVGDRIRLTALETPGHTFTHLSYALTDGEAPLDQSIELYQEGDRLKRLCEARLKAAQARIEQIAFGADGKPSGVTSFDAG